MCWVLDVTASNGCSGCGDRRRAWIVMLSSPACVTTCECRVERAAREKKGARLEVCKGGEGRAVLEQAPSVINTLDAVRVSRDPL